MLFIIQANAACRHPIGFRDVWTRTLLPIICCCGCDNPTDNRFFWDKNLTSELLEWFPNEGLSEGLAVNNVAAQLDLVKWNVGWNLIHIFLLFETSLCEQEKMVAM